MGASPGNGGGLGSEAAAVMLLGGGANLLPSWHGTDLDGGTGGLETSSLDLPIRNVGR